MQSADGDVISIHGTLRQCTHGFSTDVLFQSVTHKNTKACHNAMKKSAILLKKVGLPPMVPSKIRKHCDDKSLVAK